MTNDPCDEWPIWLIPGVLNEAITAWIKQIIPETPIMSGIMKNRAIPQGATFLFASGGTFSPVAGKRRYIPIMGEANREAIFPQEWNSSHRIYPRDHGKSRYVQAHMCADGQHLWSGWGNYIPAPINYEIVCKPTVFPLEPAKIEAYRWRYCECGAAERETWATGEIKRYAAGERIPSNDHTDS